MTPDTRPQRHAWAQGDYLHKCQTCSTQFFGDKYARICADCAYALPDPSQTKATSMKSTTEPETKKAHPIQDKYQVFSAIKDLADAANDFSRWGDEYCNTMQKVGSALRSITEFVASNEDPGTFTDEGANVSSWLHTWLRKYEDCTPTTALYTMIQQSRAQPVWAAFCNKLAKSKRWTSAEEEAECVRRESSNPDAIILYALITVWGKQSYKQIEEELKKP